MYTSAWSRRWLYTVVVPQRPAPMIRKFGSMDSDVVIGKGRRGRKARAVIGDLFVRQRRGQRRGAEIEPRGRRDGVQERVVPLAPHVDAVVLFDPPARGRRALPGIVGRGGEARQLRRHVAGCC